uniref:Uncharacterized protein n=1 Tax=Bactrocera dorsalis TaxID=27457 RepID=A0A034WMH9_BACDO
MDGCIIDGKRYNADEVANMLCDDFEDKVDIPKNENLSFDDEESADALDELIDETRNPQRVRNQAEIDYELLDEDSINDSFLKEMNEDDVNVSVLQTSSITAPDEYVSVDLSIVRQELPSPPKKRRLVLSTPVPLESSCSEEAIRKECCIFCLRVVDSRKIF